MNAVNNNNANPGTAGLGDSQKRPYPGNSAGPAVASFSDVLRNLDGIHVRMGNPADDLGIAQPVQPSPQQATPTPADKPPSEQQAAHTPDGPSETQRQEARAAAAKAAQPAPATPATPDAGEETQGTTEDPACNAVPTAQTAQASDDGTEKPDASADTEAAGRPPHTEPVDERAIRKARTAKLLDAGATASGPATAQHNTAQLDPSLAQAAKLSRAPARDAKADASADAASSKTDGKEASNIPRKGGPMTGRSDARVADQRADARADAQAAAPASGAAADAKPGAAAIASSFASDLRSALGGGAPRAASDVQTALGAVGAAGNANASGSTSSAQASDASAPAAALMTLTTPLDDSGFGAELGARLSVLTQDGVQHAELHLNPAEMGPVAVQISVDGQQAQVSFHAAHAATRSALEQSLPDLAAALSAAGFTLSGGGVFQQQSQGGQARQDGGGQSGPNGNNQRTTGIAGADATASAGISNGPRRGGPVQALVDLYA